jgi:hypothetical protein
MNTITEMEHRKATLRAEMRLEEERHAKAVQGFKDEFRMAEERIQIASGNLDEAAIILAEHVMYVGGLYCKAGDDRDAALANAKAQILSGGGTLRVEYQGTKSYDRWRGQWIACSYGMGPRHGSTIFEIGLTDPIRKREQDPLLTGDEIEACLYYLNNLERIQGAREKAKQAA